MKKGEATYSDYQKAKSVIEMHRPSFLIDREAYPRGVWVYVETALTQNNYKFDRQIDEKIHRYVYTGKEAAQGI